MESKLAMGNANTSSIAIESAGTIDSDPDIAILRANGHESVLKRQFNWFSALALGFTITNSWVGYLVGQGKFKQFRSEADRVV